MTEIVLGPPGTGKTTRLLKYVDDEITSGVPTEQIAYISFTRRAAEEAVTRACANFKLVRSAFPYFRTLHSLCYRSLGLTKSDVMSDAKLHEFADWLGIRISGHWSEDGTFIGQELGDRALHIDNMARVKQISLRDQYEIDNHDVPWSDALKISKALAMFKASHAILDYTDFLSEFLKQQIVLHDIQMLVVDEAQDLSKLQWSVVNRIAENCRRVVVAGDDDQAIYQWAGADVMSLINMKGQTTVLGQSWRVPRQVQDRANDVVSRINKRWEKDWAPRDSDGTITRVRDIYSADYSGKDILILVRNEFLLRDIRDKLKDEGIVYEYHGHPSIKERYLEAAEYWEQLRRGEDITGAEARRVYTLMSVGLGVKRGFKTLPGLQDDDPVTLSDLRSSHGLLIQDDLPWHGVLDKLPPQDVSYMMGARKRGVRLRHKPAVRLSTIHTAKGAEAEHVILLKEAAKRSHFEMERNPDEELRVWYVGVTRAKERLTLVESSNERGPVWL